MTIKLNQYTLTTEEQLNSKKIHSNVTKLSQNTLPLMKLCIFVCCWPKLVSEIADVELSCRKGLFFLLLALSSFTFYFSFFASLYLLLFHMSNFYPKKSKTVRESLLIYNAVVVSFNFDSGFCCLNCGRTIVILSIVSIE